MPVWMELRCDARSTPDAERREGDQRCWSHRNAGPMDLAADDQRSVLSVTRDLFAAAKAGGWKRTRDGWICPACVAATGRRAA